MPHPDIVAKQNEILAKTSQLEEIFAEAGPEIDLKKVKSLDGDGAGRAEEVRRRGKEIQGLHLELKSLQNVHEAQQVLSDNTLAQPKAAPPRTLGQAVTRSKTWKRWRERDTNAVWKGDLEFKALFRTTAGYDPETTRTGDTVFFPSRPIQVIDVVRQIPTSQAAVVYMEQTVRTSTAAEVAEAGTYTESAIQYAEKTSPVRKIGHFIPATDEQLEDVAVAEDLLDMDLRMMLKQRLDTQIQVGNGSGVNLRGILGYTAGPNSAVAPSSGNIGLINRGTNPHPDAVLQAITRCSLFGRAMADTLVIHPLDWETIRLTTTADGQYLWGSPALQGVMTVHGLPVIISDSITRGDAIVGDFRTHCAIHDRRDVEVQVANQHGDFFIEGKVAYRADIRCAFVVRRPSAFWKLDFNA